MKHALQKYNGYEIQLSDVGKYFDSYFNNVQKADVGRKIYCQSGLWYTESMEQAEKRKSKQRVH